LGGLYSKELLVTVILGNDKYVNVEASHAIAGVVCFNCKKPISDLRSFKRHNWAYARTELLEVLEGIRD
jgi:hypothetical protein